MNMPLPWRQRPMEVANLFNPAYLAILINQISAGYKSKTGEPLPYAVAFIALPLVMYPDYIARMPKTATAKLHIWIQENPEIVFGFAKRARNLAPFVRESISFGISNRVLSLMDGGIIGAPSFKGLKQFKELNWLMEADQLLADAKLSSLVGKLLGQIKDVPSLFSMFGVRP